MDWRHRAECADLPADLADKTFFPDTGRGTTAARTICGKCSARAECLEFAMTFTPYELYGVWGGLSPEERRKLHGRTPRVARHHYSQAEIRAIECPQCNAAPGEPCTGPKVPARARNHGERTQLYYRLAKERKGEK